MIYWWGINIGDWRFYDKIANIKSANFFPTVNPPNITPANKSFCTIYALQTLVKQHYFQYSWKILEYRLAVYKNRGQFHSASVKQT